MPMPTFPDVVAMVAVPVIDIVDAVTESVAVITAAVIEPEVSTTKPPLAAVIEPVVVNVDTVVEPAFIVPVVLILILFAKSAPIIVPFSILPLFTVAVAPINPVSPDPSPINFAAVTVPVT